MGHNNPVKYRKLGKTGLRVSEIGFGGWAIGGDLFGNSYGATSDDESRVAIRRALQLGVTFLDTAGLDDRSELAEVRLRDVCSSTKSRQGNIQFPKSISQKMTAYVPDITQHRPFIEPSEERKFTTTPRRQS